MAVAIAIAEAARFRTSLQCRGVIPEVPSGLACPVQRFVAGEHSELDAEATPVVFRVPCVCDDVIIGAPGSDVGGLPDTGAACIVAFGVP